MQNGTGDNPAGVTQPYGTPEGDIVVFAGSRAPYRPAPLNTLPNGTHVIAAGMVDETREHGSIDAPRATLILMNAAGQATYASADGDTLALYSLFLMDGVEVSVRGICRRPFVDGPPYIQVVDVEPIPA